MASPRRVGLGLSTNHAYVPEHALSTAPASPVDDQAGDVVLPVKENVTTTEMLPPPPNSTVSSLQYEDAIQETVVTTITRTRTLLPPILTRPPVDLADRDARQYVLAHAPTPAHLRSVKIEQDGRVVTLEEAADPAAKVRAYQEKQRRIREHGGTIREAARRDRDFDTPPRPAQAQNRRVQSVREGNGLKRSATPVTVQDAAELGSYERKIKKPRSSLQRTQSSMGEHQYLNQRTSAGTFQLPTNLFSASHGESSSTAPSTRDAGSRTRLRRSAMPREDLDEDEEDVQIADEDAEDAEDDSQLGPPMYGMHKKKQKQREFDAVSGASRLSGASTPPTAEDDEVETGPQPHRPERQRPQLQNILTSSQQDASLPSPSLSPITAAANAARARNQFEESFASHNDLENASVVSNLDLDDERRAAFTANSHTSAPNASAQSLSVRDIPKVVEFFDSMPDQLKTYMMYQLLRRCAKPTLQMVAGVVNPALKSDPFSVLPKELVLNITRLLDARSMCRAAQVSRKWRKTINEDETAWRDLLDSDGYVLPKDELRRAVEQGWGWQQPGEFGAEEDIRESSRTQTLSDDEETASSSRSKRKPSVKKSRSHRSKPQAVELWRRKFRNAQGPEGYANAAIEALPHPSAGLPSLQTMHLFKSLYQRHYLIRKAWMKEESQPQHLAFRAHHRHVVTCLLFDSDKILTGSDDTKICVYDTKTGALRSRLEGHEGGVWALQYVGDTLVSGSTDRSVRVWDIKSGKCSHVFQGHTSTVRCLVILQPTQVDTDADGRPIMMPTEPLIITGSRDSTLRVWKLPKPGDPKVTHHAPPTNDRDNPYFLRCLSGHHNSVRAIAAHGDRLVSGSYDCTVRVWKISNGDLIHRLQGHTQKVYSVVLDHARDRCISGSMDNLVKVWDLQTGTCLFNLEGHTSLVGLLDLSHDRLVSAAADSTLRIWDPETGACKATLSAHTGAITCFQHDGQKVISGSDRTLKMWNVRSGDCVRDLLTDLSGVWQVRFDERRCVAAVQRNNYTYIEVLDFGASRDGVPRGLLGRRVFVDSRGRETVEIDAAAAVAAAQADGVGDAAAA
ncbi:SCF ubiquitin ligase complex subunit cdc4 [Recurvomyces mirabilis]|nr:SCF ubiquitin ligase complex subunit cdc4 [Recurvomyces mirabilis]